MNDLIIAAIINEKNYSGDSSPINEDQLSAWIGDLDTNDLSKIMESFGNAVALKEEKTGNV